MKAIVLAGGHATRLWPITKNRAKPLLPLGDRPIIDYIVGGLEDFDDIIISTNQKFAADFRSYVEEFDRDARVVVENQGSEDEKPGTIGAIIKLIDKEEVDEDLLVVGGDNYLGFSFQDMMEFASDRGPSIAVHDVKDDGIASTLGIVDVDGDRITGFEEKPENPPSTLASTAVYYFPREHLSLFDEYEKHFQATEVPESQYLDEPGRLIEWAHEKTEMFAYSFRGDWFDIGTPKGYLEALDAVMEDNIIKGDTKNCEIGGNVLVLEGSSLEDVSIQNSIVFPGTSLKNSDVRNSIIDSHSDLTDVDLNDAVIGKHTEM